MSDASETNVRSGFFAETTQAAVASYQPRLPHGASLQPYLQGLIDQAKAAVGAGNGSHSAG